MKTSLKWIDRTLIESPYCIALCTSEEEYKRELKRLGIIFDGWIPPDKDGNVVEAIHDKSGNQIIIVSIRVTKQTKLIEVIGLLVHESVHAWQKICRNLSEDSPSDEFMAYSIQRIAQCLIDAYMSKKK